MPRIEDGPGNLLASLPSSEFRTWLRTNRRTLLDRTPDEVAFLAHLCGFETSEIIPVLSHFNDAILGSNFDNRMNMHISLEMTAIKARAAIDFSEQWFCLHRKIEYGLDFGE